jgi:Lrp/AsnC family leucine-responsive transcriptional regulator
MTERFVPPEHPAHRIHRPGGVDSVDREILRLLGQDGRVPISHIAAEVGLSEAATAARVRRLEERGVIVGFRVALDYARLGRPWRATIRVRLAPATEHTAFERHLRHLPAVIRAWQTTGDTDYEVLLACRDLADLDAVVADLRHYGGAEDTSTHLVLHEVNGLGHTLWAEPPGGSTVAPA